VRWSTREQAVRSGDEERLGALVLDFSAGSEADPEALRAAMLRGLSELGLEALPWTPAARVLQTRVVNVREWQPRGHWPDLSDAALAASLDEWLGPFLGGITRRGHLQRLDLEAALRARLDWSQQQALDQLLPTHFRVPSGSRVALQYRLDGPPLLAARIQELFGQAESPRVCENRVSVVVQLLSPARRPVQVTRDLAGFWRRTYFEVRKELRGRYPKHYWPDDPATATATARVRPRP
jgi:ATP-dependent helicase HrpB